MITLDDLALALPLYFANASLLFVMRRGLLGKLHRMDRPVCEGLFGKNRTWMGAGLIVLVSASGYFLLGKGFLVLPALGMIAGVHISSMLKRGMMMKESLPLPPIDQLDFFIGGAAGLALCGLYFSDLPMMMVLTFFIHLISNVIAHLAGLKDVWW